MMRLPCSDSISIRSASSLTTIAVLLMAMAPDKAKAVCQGIFHSVGARVVKNREPSVASTTVSTT